MVCYTKSVAETEELGKQTGEQLKSGAYPPFVALYGDLGVGKTAFTRGVASVLCPGAVVKSPTFTLVNEYKGNPPLFHFDLYRIENEDDLYSIGFDDYLARNGFCIAEWSEKIVPFLPPDRMDIRIEKCDGDCNARKIEIERKSERNQ